VLIGSDPGGLRGWPSRLRAGCPVPRWSALPAYGRLTCVDLTETGTLVTFLAGLAILVGVLGVLIPVIPGLLLCWAGVLLWALLGDASGGRWAVLAIATAVALAGTAVKYLWPGRRLKNTGVPTMSLVAGGVLGLIGFFVVPVVGLVLGFVLGIWLAERVRLGTSAQAWPSTRGALAAVGLSMLVEFAAALGIAVVWVFGLLAT
jgi:uncharacterized protein YqgC (DUF456 family)